MVLELFVKYKMIIVPIVIVLFVVQIIIHTNEEHYVEYVGLYTIIPTAMVLFFCICIVCRMTGLPEDAVPLEPAERNKILRELSGSWRVTPTSSGVMGMTVKFNKVYVNGNNALFSGGRKGSTQNRTLYLSRNPAGTLYIDKLGSLISSWDKAKHELHINNNLNMGMMWKRTSGGAREQKVQQPDFHNIAAALQPAVVVLPSWWEAKINPSGRVYYQNNYKMSTSWNPPTAQQIAIETQERNAEGIEMMKGETQTTANAPSDYSAPPPPFS